MAKHVADLIIETLQQAGVKRCYGIVGDTLNHVTAAIHNSGMRWVHVRHEEVGGFAAGADALLTGELAACAGSVGPGSLHFINGLYESHRNRAPVVLIASQHERGDIGFDFPQAVDYRSAYAGCSVFCEEIRTPEVAERMTARAAQAALTRGGLAVLIVPADVAKAKAPKRRGWQVHRKSALARPPQEDIAALAAALNGGGKVAIYGGSGCQHAAPDVIALARRLNAPVARTSRAKDWLEHGNPFDVGMTGIFGIDSGYEALMQCDTLLLLGCDFAWSQFYPDKAKILQLDIDPAQLGKRHPVDLGVVGDIGSTLSALLPHIEARTDDRFLKEMRAKFTQTTAQRAEPAHDKQSPIHPQYLVETIAAQANDDAVWTADGGSPMVWCLRHVPATGRNRTMISLVHGTMANAMPQALGAQAAFPGRQIISLSGDGGIAMLMGDMLTAVQENLPIKIAVFNNESLGFVELEMKVEGLVDHYTDLKNPDFGAVAQSMGWWGRRVEDPALLDGAVREWLAADGPALLDVKTNRFELVMPAHLEAQQVAGTALYSARAIMQGRIRDVARLAKDFLD